MKYEDASLTRGDTVSLSQRFPTAGRHYNPVKCCKLPTQQCHIFSSTAVITLNIIIKYILPITTMMCHTQWCVSVQDTKRVTIISNKRSLLKFHWLLFMGKRHVNLQTVTIIMLITDSTGKSFYSNFLMTQSINKIKEFQWQMNELVKNSDGIMLTQKLMCSREKPIPVPFCTSQIPHGLAWDFLENCTQLFMKFPAFYGT